MNKETNQTYLVGEGEVAEEEEKQKEEKKKKKKKAKHRLNQNVTIEKKRVNVAEGAKVK